ncbi:hypothetical protein EOM60_01805 [Candidatus Saccharibacteria bacterium]|nr:hypothetical protein [Candidatus Saccharibacteria bacterium]
MASGESIEQRISTTPYPAKYDLEKRTVSPARVVIELVTTETFPPSKSGLEPRKVDRIPLMVFETKGSTELNYYRSAPLTGVVEEKDTVMSEQVTKLREAGYEPVYPYSTTDGDESAEQNPEAERPRITKREALMRVCASFGIAGTALMPNLSAALQEHTPSQE